MTNDETKIFPAAARMMAGRLFRHSDFIIRHCFVIRDFVIRNSNCHTARSRRLF